MTIKARNIGNGVIPRIGDYFIAASDAPDSVKDLADYVCKGTDDQSDFEDALSKIRTQGFGTLQASGGTFYLSSQIDIDFSNLVFKGSGPGITNFYVSNGANSNAIKIAGSGSDLHHITLEGFSIDGNGANQDDHADSTTNKLTRSGIWWDGTNAGMTDFRMRDVEVTGCRGMGVSLDGAATNILSRAWIEDCRFHTNGNAAWRDAVDGLHFGYGFDINVARLINYTNTDTGIAMDFVDNANLTDCISRANTGNQFACARESSHVTYNHCTADGFDVGDYGIRTGTFGDGSAANQLDVRIQNCHILDNVTTGLHLEDIALVMWEFNRFSGNGQVLGLTGSVTFSLPFGNIGYTSEAGGTATIANATTSIDVTHGLSGTPQAKNIMVVPTNDQGNASHFWISNIGATTFRINCNADPGAGTATYAWQASLKL